MMKTKRAVELVLLEVRRRRNEIKAEIFEAQEEISRLECKLQSLLVAEFVEMWVQPD